MMELGDLFYGLLAIVLGLGFYLNLLPLPYDLPETFHSYVGILFALLGLLYIGAKITSGKKRRTQL